MDLEQADSLITNAPFLEFRELRFDSQEVNLETGEVELQIGDPFKPTELTGAYLEQANIVRHSVTNELLVTLQFNKEGADLFKDITTRNLGQRIAIYIDGVPVNVATVQDVIDGGQAQISGIGNFEEARELVRNLNAGAVPIPISLLSEQVIGPSLGSVSLKQSMNAGLWGFVAVVMFMVVFYRIPGVLASFSLLFFLLVLLSALKLFGITLTLAGIAGVILSVGMAVDANILIFSRMREELARGKTFSVALQEGFQRAWPAIRDGNLTTIFVALILFFVGSSFVQGFALLLLLGIVTSLFSAIFVTRGMLTLFERTRLSTSPRLWR